MSGHTRQGLKCRICKMNVHVDCQEKAPKCQTKARLLRRQKSTSEIETRVPESTAEEESEYCVCCTTCACYCHVQIDVCYILWSMMVSLQTNENIYCLTACSLCSYEIPQIFFNIKRDSLFSAS